MEQDEFLDCLLELVLLCDKAGRIVECNQAAIKALGYGKEDLPVPVQDVLPGVFGCGDGAGPGAAVGAVLPELCWGEVGETECYRKNQTCFPVEFRLSRIDEGRFMCTALDVSKRREAEREYIRIQEARAVVLKDKNEFVSNITHELRTPVNGIMGMAKSLLDTPLTPMQLETVNIIDRSCVNMAKMINDLLDFSKMEAGKLGIEEKPFAFRGFLNRTMAFELALASEKGLKLLLNVADNIPEYLVGDELRLTQILNNLIGNAVKFTTVGYVALEVTMTMETEEQVELFFMVIDTGIGIAKENMDKLFKSFSQVDASITRRFGGTGLGLAICRRLVDQMGGSIKVDSDEGKGSAFSFNVLLKKAKEPVVDTDVQFPSGKFIYEGSSRYLRDAEKSSPGSVGNAWDFLADVEDMQAVYQFGTRENLEEIRKNMEKLLICIEMGNWEKAENFAGVIKSLITEDNRDLKRAAFRLELTVRKEDHDRALKDYENLKTMLAELPFP